MLLFGGDKGSGELAYFGWRFWDLVPPRRRQEDKNTPFACWAWLSLLGLGRAGWTLGSVLGLVVVVVVAVMLWLKVAATAELGKKLAV